MWVKGVTCFRASFSTLVDSSQMGVMNIQTNCKQDDLGLMFCLFWWHDLNGRQTRFWICLCLFRKIVVTRRWNCSTSWDNTVQFLVEIGNSKGILGIAKEVMENFLCTPAWDGREVLCTSTIDQQHFHYLLVSCFLDMMSFWNHCSWWGWCESHQIYVMSAGISCTRCRL